VPVAYAIRLRGNIANPLNLIRFVPAEGLDADLSGAKSFNTRQDPEKLQTFRPKIMPKI
jgi:hypothetical protein